MWRAQDSVRLRMQSNLAAGEPGYESVRVMFAEALPAMSQGRLTIDLFPAGALFPMADGLEAVSAGIAEIGMMAGGYFVGKMGPIAAMEMDLPGPSAARSSAAASSIKPVSSSWRARPMAPMASAG